MTPDRWRRIKEVFDAALEQDESRRNAWLEQTCDGDESLLSEVASLLAAHDGPPNFIDTPVMERALAAATPPSALTWIGRTIGHYRIIEEIGRGGMSAVFKAARVEEHFEHQVAIKLLRQSHDTELLLRRFRAERQILARLSHPNIAHLLDGGSTEEGLPYLVMEYVRGEPIDAHCERRHLDVTARLRLFRTLCDAVHYVHRHLMVHGDLKCSNVLVNEDGIVKLLDFGIAKLLDSAPSFGITHHRLTGVMAMTPEYASPEQIRGQPITTASDVYSLGVLLYKLLTLELPYRTRSGAYYDLATQICEAAPRRPSVAAATRPDSPCSAQRLRGDLDNIILKALHKDPDQRYTSVEQLSQDIGRYLGGFPVMAVPESTRYRLTKFVGRNRALAVTGALVAVSLVTGIVATSWQAHLANRERLRAERHFEDVRKLAQTFMLDVHDSMANLPGTTQARARIIENTVRYLDALSRENAGDSAVRRDLGRAYERVGDLQGGMQAANLEDTEAGLANYRKALSIRDTLWEQGERDEELLRDRLRTNSKLAQHSLANRAMDDARRYSNAAKAIAESLVKRPAATAEDHRLLGNAFVVRGTIEAMAGPAELGIAEIRKGAAVFEQQVLKGDKSWNMRRSLVIAHSRTASLLAKRAGKFAEAYPMHLRALAVADSMLAEDPRNGELRKISAYDLLGIGEAAAHLGDLKEARLKREQGADRIRALLAAEPESEAFQFDMSWALGDLSDSLHAEGDFNGAAELLTQAQSSLKKLTGATSTRLNTTQFLLAMNDMRLGHVRISQASAARTPRTDRRTRWLEAQALLERAAGVFAAAASDVLFSAEAGTFLASSKTGLSQCEEALRALGDARGS